MTKLELQIELDTYKYLMEGVRYYFYNNAPGRTLKETVENLKAFDIIKEHRVDLWWLMDSVSCEDYNQKVKIPQLQLNVLDYRFLRKVFGYDFKM